MNVVEILTQDYQRFPFDQTYGIYGENVYFKDPMNEFRGLQRYQKMIDFITTWFKEVKMDLHAIKRSGNIIHTEWTLCWTTPLPWKPSIAISGRSELTLNSDDEVISHIDYWNCSRLDVLKQHFFPQSPPSTPKS